MTALVVLIIAVAVLVLVIGAVAANSRQLRNKDLEVRNLALLGLCQTQKSLIGKIEKEALQYGYPTDPLSFNVVTYIQEAREKENSK